ncbi:hypothetical protein [uncultured Desulfuromusa sp.]|uniref:helix-turn-helix domain-containing protein n=1 Tax=uncultured Desulfuromusa sp. TaxID=219183 RepID=UPI002AA735E3|nr:hypothetical protein [uncultured Desulfuromusa sp.]
MAIEQIKQYCQFEKISLFALSKEVGVGQPALYRFLNGERKTITDTAQQVLDYVNSRHNWHNNDAVLIQEDKKNTNYKVIEDAVLSLWDGNRNTAELIASLIRALKPALDMAKAVTMNDQERSR